MTVTASLIDAGAATAGAGPYAATIDLDENSSSTFHFPTRMATALLEGVASIFEEPAFRALVATSVGIGPNGSSWVSLSTGSVVGFASAGPTDQKVFLRVRPKIPVVRLLELASIAKRLPPWSENVHIGHDDVSAMLEWTIRSFVSSLEDLISKGGLRSTHERVRNTLNGRLRGKLLVPAFIGHMSKGQPNRIPCEYSELLRDNPLNRLLKWTVRFALDAAKQLGGLEALTGRLVRADVHLRDIPLTAPSLTVLEHGPKLTPNTRHYEQCVVLARMLLRSVYLNARAGNSAAVCVAVNMNDLYEAAFWTLLRQCEPAAIKKPTWKVDLKHLATDRTAKTATFEPDVFVPSNKGDYAVVMDTKWKEAFSTDEIFPVVNAALVKPKTSDIYQATSYAAHHLSRNSNEPMCIAALVYPCIGEVIDLYCSVALGSQSVVIRFLGWDLSLPPADATAKLWKQMQVERSRPKAAGESVSLP